VAEVSAPFWLLVGFVVGIGIAGIGIGILLDRWYRGP
jgi:F0F1-type ATP synthase assembly protein I